MFKDRLLPCSYLSPYFLPCYQRRKVPTIHQQLPLFFLHVKELLHANNQQIHYFFSQLKSLLNGKISKKTVTILGTAFKPNTDDIRESASVKLINLLLEEGSNIHFTDPKAIKNTINLYGNNVTSFSSSYEAAKDSDAIVLMTEWNAFRNLDLPRLKSLLNQPNFVDFRLIYSQAELTSAGFNSYILGKGHHMGQKVSSLH